jgi:hypothetical protein
MKYIKESKVKYNKHKKENKKCQNKELQTTTKYKKGK